MIYKLFEALLFGVAAGIIGSVYREVLAYEKPFTLWWQFGARYEKRWFFRPVWACGKCFSGQLAAWGWLIIKIIPLAIEETGLFYGIGVNPLVYTGRAAMGLFCFILAISAAISTAVFLSGKLKQ